MAALEGKELKIIEESLRLFRKHGFQKVTISDIAQAVGVSRPTVYALFPNKQAIFGKYVTSHFDQMEAETDNQLSSAKTLRDRLQVILNVWVIAGVSQALVSEEGRDVIANCGVYAPDAVTTMYDKIENYVYQAIKVDTRDSARARDAARIVRTAVKGQKEATSDLADLQRFVRTLVLMTAAFFE